jgi:hypothetical protein
MERNFIAKGKTKDDASRKKGTQEKAKEGNRGFP